MNCPGCGTEMIDLEDAEQQLRVCASCTGCWTDSAVLNRLLLHSNLPGLESLGGRVTPKDTGAACEECQIDLTRIENGDRRAPEFYETCEACGGVFVQTNVEAATDLASAGAAIVESFRRFALKKKRTL
jgi:Zn-finger nucleic acid-binding protein